MSCCRRLAFLGILALGSRALAQETPSGDAADRGLGYFTGTWDVHLVFRLPDGSEGKGRAACEARSILGGAFVQQAYTSTFRGQPLEIRQFLGYDEPRRRFVLFQLHAGGGAPIQTRRLEGVYSEDGTVLTLEGDSFDPFNGAPVRLRTVTRIVDEDRFIVQEWFERPGEDWERMVVLHHVRASRHR